MYTICYNIMYTQYAHICIVHIICLHAGVRKATFVVAINTRSKLLITIICIYNCNNFLFITAIWIEFFSLTCICIQIFYVQFNFIIQILSFLPRSSNRWNHRGSNEHFGGFDARCYLRLWPFDNFIENKYFVCSFLYSQTNTDLLLVKGHAKPK